MRPLFAYLAGAARRAAFSQKPRGFSTVSGLSSCSKQIGGRLLAGTTLTTLGWFVYEYKADVLARLSAPIGCDALAQPDMQIEPTSRKQVPTLLTINSLPFQLIALGVRQVTLLYISVYTVALYAAKSGLEQKNLASMIDAEKYFVKGAGAGVNKFVHDNQLVLRIEPTRPVNGNHLKKGFLKLLETRLVDEVKDMSAIEIKAIQDDLARLRASFPSGELKMGSYFTFVKDKDQTLQVYHEVNLVLHQHTVDSIDSLSFYDENTGQTTHFLDVCMDFESILPSVS